MFRHTLILIFAISASLAFAQLDSNSITVTASKTVSPQPDQVRLSVNVTSGFDTSLDEVLAAIAGSGITLANFNNVYSQPSIILFPSGTPAPAVDWSFSLAVPISQLKSTLAALTALKQTITQKNSGMSLSFTVIGTQVSTELEQSQTCSVPDLVAEARAQAQKLANAAGVTMGGILAMSTNTACSLTVKFQLIRLS